MIMIMVMNDYQRISTIFFKCYLVEAQELDLECLINFEIDLCKERYYLEDDLEVNQ